MRIVVPIFLAVCFVVCTTDNASAQKKKAAKGPITGKVLEVDTEKNFIRMLVVTRNKKATEESSPSFKINDDTKITFEGDKKEMTGPDGLKEIKKDDTATVTLDGDYKTVSIKIVRARK